MAEVKEKLPENTRGKFYVDRQCIDCDVCRDTAPKNFTRYDENGYSYVTNSRKRRKNTNCAKKRAMRAQSKQSAMTEIKN
jgi:ferredoxin